MSHYDERSGAVVQLPGGRPYEGHVRYADSSIVSLQCFEDRHQECPQVALTQQADDFGAGPLEGFHCECGCHSEVVGG